VLIKPASPRASVILMPGGSGAINPGEHGEINGLKGNQLVRTRSAYAARGDAGLISTAREPAMVTVSSARAAGALSTAISTARRQEIRMQCLVMSLLFTGLGQNATLSFSKKHSRRCSHP
jgi:hypothetical protein